MMSSLLGYILKPYVIVVGAPIFSFIVTRSPWTAEALPGQPLVV